MNPFDFLINTVFDLYLSVVLLRLWLQLVRADFYNPFCQFVVKATNPVLKPLRRIIPGFGGFDVASLVLAILIVMGKLLLLQALGFLGATSAGMLILFSVLTVIKKAGYLLFWVLIIRAILSWVSQGRSPIEYVMHQLTEPLMAPVRRMLPDMGGLDLSILIIFFGLQFINYGLLWLLGPIWTFI
ncbi:YggT family protein [Motilimonas pumila]|uniref:YggT family protein n=1 Tax=Motilimonas pumila TaxID=2303987 RepID=A0A418YAR3_9GAMM|nr:YggT family protein [Motilimonas pumila]RJG40028.1 YggT family protein [Motilimonas pumila]